VAGYAWYRAIRWRLPRGTDRATRSSGSLAHIPLDRQIEQAAECPAADPHRL
jgi:hypothetical protein